MRPRKHWTACARFPLLSAVVGTVLIFAGGCQSSPQTPPANVPMRDINQVLADYDEQLLAIPGVVGVGIALWADQKTLCLKVMLARDEKSVRESIPQTIEGHPVVTEVTGELRPLRR